MPKPRKEKPKAFMCPNCGEVVPAGVLACPECGADEHTGWSENTMYDELDLPDQGWGQPQEPARTKGWPMKVFAIGLVAIAIILLLFKR